MALTNRLTVIADAIRAKTGGTETMTLDQMPSVIEGIQSGGGDMDALIDRSITKVSSNVETVGNYMFQDCVNLTTANFPNATIIGAYCFENCKALTTINFPKVTKIDGSYAFSNCVGLTNVELPLVESISSYTFKNSTSLLTVNLPLATSVGFSSFEGCSKLENVNLPVLTNVESGLFKSCAQLKMMDLPLVKSIASNAFYTCVGMKALILRSETACTLASTNAFTNCAAYIYVPSALVDTYKAATNWSTYAAKFRALEDYTVDGTITGALDETKI